ncbi:MAG: hypothetical protein WCT23_08640 [Candidatus Neomarinimicrobiota bacterium]
MGEQLCPDMVSAIKVRVKARGLRRTAREVGVSPSTLARVLAGGGVHPRTAAVLRRVPSRVRTAADFSDVPNVRPPKPRETATSWSVPKIRSAIEDQMRGQFLQPKRLAEAMRRDDAIYVARSNRLAPIQVVAAELREHDSARGRAIARKAIDSVQAPRTVLAGIDGTLVDHDVAIGYVEREPNASGTRIDMRLTEWPLEHVRWNPTIESLETQTRDGVITPITHGDGRWIIFRRFAFMPWREMACLLPAAFVWAAHAEGVSDWQASSRAHGLAKIVGELAEGYTLNDENDELPIGAQRFYDMLTDMAEGDSAVALRPPGAKTDFLSNGSNAWQVFAENIVSREKAAARIYLGTDAILGSVGGAPGIDIAQLFGLASTKFQSDFDAIHSGLDTGLYEPWAALNEGDTRYAPSMRFQLPDPDRDGRRDEIARNRLRLTDGIAAMRAQGLEVTQEVVDRMARDYGVEPAPRLAAVA